MSKQTLECVIGKIVLDASFREALLAAPDPILAGYDLLESEKTWLKTIDLETMEALSLTLAHCLGKFCSQSQGSKSRSISNGGKNDV